MSKITAGVIVVSQFVASTSKTFGTYIDYIDRSQAVRSDKYQEYSIETLQEELNKYNGYMDYMDNPEKTSELFTAEKDKLSIEQKAKLKEVFQTAQDNGSLMWQTVISFDNRWLAENGLYDLETHSVNEAKLKECARGAVNKLLENENLSSSTIWSAAIHYNTKHLHMHIAMVEPYPTREIIQEGKYAGQRKGKFKKESLEKAKSFVVNNIISQKNNNHAINDIFRNSLLAAMKSNDILANKDLQELYLKIYQQLPTNKRLWQYNRNIMASVRPDINKFITKWLQTEKKADFENLQQEIRKQQAVYETAYGTRKNPKEKSFYDNKIDELYMRLGNAILSNLKTLDISDLSNLPSFQSSIEEIPTSIIEETLDKSSVNNEPDIVIEEFPFEKPPQEIFRKYTDRYKIAKKELHNIENMKKQDFTKAFQLMSAEAKSGNIYAIYDLANFYAKGIGCSINTDKAFDLYKIALKGFQDELLQMQSSTDQEETKGNTISYLNYRIAKMYYYGLGTEKDLDTAFSTFQTSDFASDDNVYLFSHYYLARFYENGEVVNKDPKTAFEYYNTVAQKTIEAHNSTDPKKPKLEMPYAVYKIAQLYENGEGCIKDMSMANTYYKEALSLFLESEEKQPDDQLEYRIGKMYYEGKGTEKNQNEALKFFKRSAELGNDMANYMIAMIYIKDPTSDQETIKKAIEILTASADEKHNNNELAQYQLGSIYLKSSDPNDIQKGIHYLTLSANQGNQFAQYRLGSYLLKKDPQKAISYLKAASEQGNMFAKYKLGTYYLQLPQRTEQDICTGLSYLKEISASDNKCNCFADYQLGKFYMSGNDVAKDLEKAESFLLKALLERSEDFDNFTQIEHKLGVLYFDGGENFKADPSLGLAYLTKAADAGNQYSQYKLGAIYYYGTNGVKQDLDKSISYLSLSATQGNQYAIKLLDKMSTPPPPTIKPLYMNLDFNTNFSTAIRAMGREYTTYDNILNQQIYQEMERESEL